MYSICIKKLMRCEPTLLNIQKTTCKSYIEISVINESDVKQTKSISIHIHTTCKVGHPTRAGITKHVYK